MMAAACKWVGGQTVSVRARVSVRGRVSIRVRVSVSVRARVSVSVSVRVSAACWLEEQMCSDMRVISPNIHYIETQTDPP